MLRCEPIRASSSRTTEGNPVSGGTPSPGICPLCCCRLKIRPILIWCANWCRAHSYWRLKGLAVDLVIWNEDHAGYRQLLHDQIMGAHCRGRRRQRDRSTRRYFRKARRPDSGRGPHPDPNGCSGHNRRQPWNAGGPDQRPHFTGSNRNPLLNPTRTQRSETLEVAPAPRHDLTFYNGLGDSPRMGASMLLPPPRGSLHRRLG